MVMPAASAAAGTAPAIVAAPNPFKKARLLGTDGRSFFSLFDDEDWSDVPVCASIEVSLQSFHAAAPSSLKDCSTPRTHVLSKKSY